MAIKNAANAKSAIVKSLVIVESPAKAKTIEKYLGKGFEVLASVGHIMDLPKSDLGVELKDRTFEPTLQVSPGKEKVVAQLKKAAVDGLVAELEAEISALQDPDLYAMDPSIAWRRLKPRTTNKRFLAMVASLAAYQADYFNIERLSKLMGMPF